MTPITGDTASSLCFVFFISIHFQLPPLTTDTVKIHWKLLLCGSLIISASSTDEFPAHENVCVFRVAFGTLSAYS